MSGFYRKTFSQKSASRKVHVILRGARVVGSARQDSPRVYDAVELGSFTVYDKGKGGKEK